MGVTECVLKYEQLKPKYGVFLQDFSAATVTYYVTKMIESFSAKSDMVPKHCCSVIKCCSVNPSNKNVSFKC